MNFANEYYNILVNHSSPSDLDPFLNLFINKEDYSKIYRSLPPQLQERARDIIYSAIVFTPNFIDERVVLRCLRDDESRGGRTIQSAIKLLDEYRKEKEAHKNDEQIPFHDIQNIYFWTITAVGKRLTPANPEYIEKEDFKLISTG